MTHEIEQQLEAIATELQQAKRVLFITGAGISADSGLPTYRGVGGLYNTETTEEGYSIEQCLSASMFRVRPDITWKYMLPLVALTRSCLARLTGGNGGGTTCGEVSQKEVTAVFERTITY